MKTIKELNEKSWYRLLKVLFILSFILSIILTFIFSFNFFKIKYIDINKIKTAMEFAKNNPDSDYATELRRRIEEGSLNNELQAAGYSQYIPKTKLPGKLDSISESIVSVTSSSTNKEVLISKSDEILAVLKKISFSLLVTLFISLFFILIRNTFYYIVLGKFRPKE